MRRGQGIRAKPSIFWVTICPEARHKDQKRMPAVLAFGRTAWVLIRCLNPSCKRSMPFVVRADLRWFARNARE
jgi:hypothetical protein